MRHHGVIVWPALRAVIAHQTGHRIGHGVRHMAAGVAKPDPGQHAGEHQWLTRRNIVRRVEGVLDIGTD